jgi:RluA family pseudouridine synthase
VADVRTFRLRTAVSHQGQRLDVVLGTWLAEALGRPLSKSFLRRLIMAGGVQLDGRPTRAPGRPLDAGQALLARIDASRLPPTSEASDEAFAVRPAILFEDDALIAVDKPPGLPTVPTADPVRPSLVRAVETHLQRTSAWKGVLGVHQRLDRDTSGVVLFAKAPAANPALAQAFAGREVNKTYHALTMRPRRLPPSSWRVSDRLAAVAKGRMGRVEGSGQAAVTDFMLLEVFATGLLVEAHPRTGRKHQVRVHLAEAGLPVLGDPLYGDPGGAAPRVMLHAWRLELAHPVTGAPLVIESPWPPDFRRSLEGMSEPRFRTSEASRPGKLPGRRAGPRGTRSHGGAGAGGVLRRAPPRGR